MSKGKVGDVNVEQTGNKEWETDYRESDVEVVFRRGDWENWDEVIDWLETEGEADNELTPGEVLAMHDDLVELRDRGVPFSADPDEVYRLAHKSRHPKPHPERS